MAKKAFVAYSSMTKKQKFLNFLKLFGFAFAFVATIVAGSVIYVWATGGLSPKYVPLETMAFSQSEYVVVGGKEIEIDEETGKQKKTENGNAVWVHPKNADGKEIYDYVLIQPNEECTELDAILTIEFSSNLSSPIIQLYEDENVSPVNKDEENEDKIYYDYNVKIGSPIYIKPLTKMVTINGEEVETNIGGWVKLTATEKTKDGKKGFINASTWVFVDSPILDYKISIADNVEYDEETATYSVYPNSAISLTNTLLPSNALILPKTAVPTQKATTQFTNNKKVYYETSNAEIATVSENGIVSIQKDKEGETFSITAYVIAKYNSVGHEPNIQDFATDPSQDAFVPYTKAFDKIRVWANTLTFKIKEISVTGIETKQLSTTPSYEVFEDGNITFSNQILTPSKNNYYINLALTNPQDQNYLQALLSKVQIGVYYDGYNVVDEGSVYYDEFVVGGKKLIDGSDYVELNKKTDNTYGYKIKNYSQNNFYFVFYYDKVNDDEVTERLYTYIPFKLSKKSVEKVEILDKNNMPLTSLNLDFNQETALNTAFDLNNYKISISPKDTTYSYSLYFVPKDTNLVQTDSNIKVVIANQICEAVGVEKDGTFDYSKIYPLAAGKTKLYVAVLKTTQKYDGNNSVEFVSNGSSYEIEMYSNSVTLNIVTTVNFTNLSTNNELTDTDKIENLKGIGGQNPYNQATQPDEYEFVNGCDIYAEVYMGGRISFDLLYIGEKEALENGRLNVGLIENSDITVAGVSYSNNDVDGIYVFSILANQIGIVKFLVTYDDDAIYTIGIRVLSTQLVGLNLSSNKNIIDGLFNNNGNNITYSWNDVKLNLAFNSPKTETTQYELVSYALPNWFDENAVSKYVGKDYTEQVAGVSEAYNTLEKLIRALENDESVLDSAIRIDNTATNIDAKIIVMDNAFSLGGSSSQRGYKFVALGKVLVFAKSTSNDVHSNPVLFEVKAPEIKIYESVSGAELTSKRVNQVYVTGVKSIDGHNDENEYMLTQGIKFMSNGMDITNLIAFRFENSRFQGQRIISDISNATITNGLKNSITFTHINGEMSENIVAYNDSFGYVCDDFLEYNLIPDYDFKVTNSKKVYNTPQNINLFYGSFVKTTDDVKVAGKDYYEIEYIYTIVNNPVETDIDNYYEKDGGEFKKAELPYDDEKLYYTREFDCYTIDTADEFKLGVEYYEWLKPDVLVTSVNYSEDGVLQNNKLYVMAGSNATLSNLKKYFPREFLEKFRYADVNNEYYHIYASLMIASDDANGDNYVAYNENTITLAYKETMQSISINAITEGDYKKSISIKVAPGIESQFRYNSKNTYTQSVDSLTDDQFDISDKLIFSNSEQYVAFVSNIDFAFEKDANADLTFYSVNSTEKRLETYVSIYSENIEYIQYDAFTVDSSKFEPTQDKARDLSKTYYTFSNGKFSEVENFDVEQINTYYETSYKYYFIQTPVVSDIDNEKTYYEKTENGFVEVENPTIDKIDDYFEKVFSDKVYYASNTHFEKILQKELSSSYIKRYYEAVYQKASGEYDENENYYTVNQNGVYVLVENKNESDFNSYYVFAGNYQLTSDREIVENKEYFYLKNYIELDEGSDITVVYQKLTIGLEMDSTTIAGEDNSFNGVVLGEYNIVKNIRLNFDKEVLKTTNSPIHIAFSIKAYLINKNDNSISQYNNYSYRLSFE